MKIAVLCSHNLDLFLPVFEQVLLSQPWVDGELTVWAPPFSEIRQQMIDKTSALMTFDADITFMFHCFEDFFDPYFQAEFSEAEWKPYWEEQAQLIHHYDENSRGLIFVSDWVNLVSFDRLTRKQHSIEALINGDQADFRACLPQSHRIKSFSFEPIVKSFHGERVDPRLKMIGRFPFSDAFGRHLASWLVGWVAAARGQSIRLIVTDCDNTLWGGVLGEDGLSHLDIGGDFPGNCYTAFQHALKRLKNRGIPLAISSKNDAELVKEAFDTLTMPLKWNDFLAHEIHWEPKAESIRRIANELQIGLSHILFLDDSKIECEAVKRVLPEVVVCHLPEDPVYLIAALNGVPALDFVTLTEADLKRSESYVQRKNWLENKNQPGDLTSFYQNLGLHILLSELSVSNVHRVHQLFLKTNQFNFTQKRYSMDDLMNHQLAQHLVIAIGIEDNYSSQEIMGAMVLLKTGESSWLLDNYVMSCRSLGKKAEIEALKAVLIYLKERGARSVEIRWVKTERNQPIALLLQEAEFIVETGDCGRYSCALTDSSIELSSWLTLTRELLVC